MRRYFEWSWKGVWFFLLEKFNFSFLDDDDDDENDDDDEVMSRFMMMSGVIWDVYVVVCCLMMFKLGKRKVNFEVRSFSYCNDEMDVKGLIVDMKIKVEIEVNVSNF